MATRTAAFFIRAFRFPWRLFTNIRLFLYFVIVVCCVGPLGAHIQTIQLACGSQTLTWQTIQRSFAIYVIAIVVRAFADCLVRDNDEDDPTFRLFLLGVSLAAVGFAAGALLAAEPELVHTCAMVALILAAVVWLMVNDANPALDVNASAYDTIGGERPR
jgi:hypothetical protein